MMAGSMAIEPGTALEPELRRLVDAARPLLGQPLRASPDRLGGYIETVAVDEAGRVWVMGWLKRALAPECSLVIADRRRYAGALSAICFPRDDLPADAQAMIGVITSDWRPGPNSVDLFCFLAPELNFYLRGITPLQIVDTKVIGEHWARVQPLATIGRVGPLRALQLDAGEWTPHAARAGFSVKASVDRVLVLPGFGAFVEGWVLSPSKPVVQYSLRLGRKVLHGVPGSLVQRARPDIGTVGPHTPRLLERAGFVVALEGALDQADLVEPILKAHFADGSSANIQVDPEIVWRIGHAVPADDVLRFYPGLAEESFFPRFAAALRQDMAGRLGQVASIAQPRPAPHCVVAAVPGHAADARLMAEELAQALRPLPNPPAVVLLADAGTSRAELPLLARGIAEATGQRCGIALVEQADKPLWALPAVLEQAGCERFLFLAMHAFPDSAAWAAALAALAGTGEAPHALRHKAPGGLAALVWTRAAYAAWLQGTAPALGRSHADALLRHATPLPGSVLSALPLVPGEKVLEAIDQMDGNTLP